MTPNSANAADKLLQQSDLTYLGAFRVPKIAGFLIGGGAGFDFNPNGNSGSGSFFITGAGRMVEEISLPAVINSTDMGNLNTASVIQSPVDIGNGHNTNEYLGGDSCDNGCGTQGVLVYGNKLVGAMSTYYDATYSQAYSHFTHSINLSTNDFAGMYRVGPGGANGGFVGGYMTRVPDNTTLGGTNWQAAFGGTALTGQAFPNIITRSSNGPCAFAFDPDLLGSADPSPATMLVGYPDGHWTLGDWGTFNQNISIADRISSVVFPQGSKSIVFFGKHGTGASCYGEATGNLSQEKTAVDLQAWFIANGVGSTYACGGAEMTNENAQSGDGCCYDPTGGGKGIHSYPYHYFAWAYDANELAAVKLGSKNPWDIFPYQTWNMDNLFSNFLPGWSEKSIKGAAYNPATQILYLAQQDGDKYTEYDSYPLIHAFKLSLPSQTSDSAAPSSPTSLSLQ